MANYYAIKAAVNAYIKQNGRKEITGSILNAVLNATIDSLGRFFQFAGGAMPTDDPGTPDQNVCYLATEPGLYTHFGNIRIANEEVALLFWNGEWVKESIALGIQEVNASVDNQVGTPSVDVSYSGGQLVLTFHNLKGEQGIQGIQGIQGEQGVQGIQGVQGEQGETGDPAGFGYIGADISGGLGTPGVSVETSGSNTAKNMMFHFTNLKGDPGVSSVIATIDNTSGNPSCQVTLANGVLTLAFSGLKGLKGDTGVSADYPITIYNGLDSDATDQALSAAQGKALNGRLSNLEQEVNGGTEETYITQSLYADHYYGTNGQTMALQNGYGNATGTYCMRVAVTPGEKYKIAGKGGNQYTRLWVTADSARSKVRQSETSVDARTNPVEIIIEEGEAYLYVNLSQYDSQTDKFEKVETTYVPGIVDSISEMSQDISDINTEIVGIHDDIEDLEEQLQAISYDKVEYVLNNFKEGYLATQSMAIGDVATLPQDSTPVSSESAAGHLTLQVKNGDYVNVGFKSLSNKYCRAFIIMDSTRKILSWANPQTNEGTSETYNTLDNPVTFNVSQDGYILLQFPQSNYSDNTLLSVTHYKKKGGDTPAPAPDDDIEICVPDTIYAVVGDTLQLYYRSIFRCVDFSRYAVKVVCNIGSQYPRYYEVTPLAGNVGTHTLTFTIKDNNNNDLGAKSVNLVVVPAGVSPSNELNVLCVGASATINGEWASELKRRLVESGGTPAGSELSNIVFVGRKSVMHGGVQVNLEATGGYQFTSYTNPATKRYRFNVASSPTINIGDVYSNNGHNYTITEINITEGQGGYFSCTGNGNPEESGILTKVTGTGSATISFLSSSQSGNPFSYDGIIDMQQYADEFCNPQGAAHGRIDVLYTELFGNGTSVYMDDFTTRMSQMQAFITQVQNVFPNCKFCIGLFWNPDIRGGMGVNYGASGTWSDPYGIKYSNMNLCNALQKYITDNNLSDHVYIVNWLNEFDEENDMQQTTKPVNTRSSVREIFGVNGVHPSEIGYNQMADTAWRLFIAKFCQS